MSRPLKCRRVTYLPEITYFKPAGIPLRDLEEMILSVEEVEALRLKDLEGMEQEEAADIMNISRPTFQRILVNARKKIAEAILNGKAISIKGGNYEMAFQRFRCRSGHEWSLERAVNILPGLCPTCSSSEVKPLLTGDSGQPIKRRQYRNPINQ